MHFKKLLVQSLFWRGIYFISMLLVNVFLSRYLQADNAGVIFYVSNIFSLVVLIAGLSIESGVTYFASSGVIPKNQLALAALVWSACIALLVWVIGSLFFQYSNIVPVIRQRQYLFFAVCYIPGLLLVNSFMALFYVNRNYPLPNIIMGLLNIVIILLIPKHRVAADLTSDAVINYYFIGFLLQGLLMAFAYIISSKKFTNHIVISGKSAGLLLRYSVMALFANLLFFFVYRVDYWFVEYYCSKRQLGNYIQASKLGQMLLIVPSVIAGILFPETAKAEGEFTHSLIPFISRIISFVFGLGAIVFLITGRWLFTFLFGPSFYMMYGTMLILLPGILGLSILSLLSAYIAGRNNVPANIKGSFFTLLIIISGDLLFIPRFGIYAAAMVSTAGYLFHTVYNIWQFKKYHADKWLDFFILKAGDVTTVKKFLLQFSFQK